jgi:hypothetical protein
MIVGIHQPNYIAYLGFFDKMLKSDIFVLLDDAQFSKGDFHNRNRIKVNSGPKWITIPVKSAFRPINEVVINKDAIFSGMVWNEYHFHLIRENYGRSKYFNCFSKMLSEIYFEEYDRLIDINLNMIEFIRQGFRIKTPVFLSSELKIKTSSTQRLIDICNHFEADCYLSGQDGPKYMDMSLFEKNKIRVEVQDFKHPTYTQQYGGFVPYLSAVDALFNAGNIFEEIQWQLGLSP